MTAIQRITFEVAPVTGGWAVTRHGFARDSTHARKEAAVRRAVKLARARQPSELIIRRLDGSIQETRVYGQAPERLLGL